MKKIFFAVLLTILFVNPFETSAQTVVDQSVVRLNDQAILFTVTYRLSFLNNAIETPISTMRHLDYGSAFPHVGYDIYAKGSPFGGGKTYSIVLSDAEIVDGQYVVPESKSAEFMLTTLLVLPDGYKGTTEGVYMGMTTLPFTLTNSSREVVSQVDVEPLKAYKTDALEF